MIYQGNSLSAQLLTDGIVEFTFDAQGSVNKLIKQRSKSLKR